LTHRVFADADGREWEVWDVSPSRVEERLQEDLMRLVLRGPSDRKSTVFNLPVEMRGGWLAFQSGDECRRLAPVPGGWWQLSRSELVQLLGSADPSTPRVAVRPKRER
jgi:hypothetical protein